MDGGKISIMQWFESLPSLAEEETQLESWIERYPYSAHLWLLKGLLEKQTKGKISVNLLEQIAMRFPDSYLLGLWFHEEETYTEPLVKMVASKSDPDKAKTLEKKKKKKAKEGKRLKKLLKTQKEQQFTKQSDFPFVRWLNSLPNTRTATFKRPSQTVVSNATYTEIIEPEFEMSDGLASEELANLLLRQGHITDAKDMYSKLQLKMPEKSALFAQILEDLNKK